MSPWGWLGKENEDAVASANLIMPFLQVLSGMGAMPGVGIYTSPFFTALNDGLVSFEISSLRSLVFPVICIVLLPMLWQLDGVWYSLVASEVLSVSVSVLFLIGKRKKYQY